MFPESRKLYPFERVDCGTLEIQPTVNNNLGVGAALQGREVLDSNPSWVWWDFKPTSPTLQKEILLHTSIPSMLANHTETAFVQVGMLI